ncbi:hypothetical protein BDQ12DRAFT_17980 [Crucibulum laeve]|uniref:Zn(2)-C6 fungal-type domain-containing protein n=1 Tax=Crucibulum laeve TaxID=68775 RepID=A0A5C3MKL5_9AGAR|nr:hypothetical protein BDQ12DRAFT_17980 [Crucibulum laeve]
MSEVESSGSSSRKEKKTRRRLRLSCVECTKRRQKCDRNYPCSLCVARGVTHLCRWENVPVARPSPARPPAEALRSSSTVSNEQESTIRELTARIASLEKALAEQKNLNGSPATSPSVPPELSTSPQSSGCVDSNAATSGRASPEPPKDILPDSFLSDPLYEAISTVAQLSFGHHGEYVGRGSLICALRSISTRQVPRFMYASSTSSTSMRREDERRFSPLPTYDSIPAILQIMPEMHIVTALVDAFFIDGNWLYGIPEPWFRDAFAKMWSTLQGSSYGDSEINANWLILLFAVMASAPNSTYVEIAQHSHVRSSDDYFMCAMMARRIAEDNYLNSPSTSIISSAADGTVLGCLAIPLLCSYLAERGRVSEAWKLTGSSIVNAEAVGMHRDPAGKRWQLMSEDERLLRRRGWWGLYICDKLYSYILGRPQMIKKQDFDVALPTVINPDGTRDPFSLGQSTFIGLMELLSESMDKCFSIEYPTFVTYLEMDDKFTQWESQIPPEYRHSHNLRLSEGGVTPDMLILARQRNIVYTWYLIGRVKLYLATTVLRIQPAEATPPGPLRESMERCIAVCMKLIRFQCETRECFMNDSVDLAAQTAYPGKNWLFGGCFSLFEASVGLITTTTNAHWLKRTTEAEQLIVRALRVFENVHQQEPGKTGEATGMAIRVLTQLREQEWWGKDLQLDVKMDDDGEVKEWSPSESIVLNDAAKTIASMQPVDISSTLPNIFHPFTPFNVSDVRGSQSQEPSANLRLQDSQTVSGEYDWRGMSSYRQS